MKKGVAIAVVVLAVAGAGVVYWLSGEQQPQSQPSAAGPTAPATDAPEQPDTSSDNLTASPATTVSPAQSPDRTPEPVGFCERDFDDTDAREADTEALENAGGLVYIFEREARLDDPYGCADYYLAHGLEIDAVDPRDDHAPLTGLFFAIKRNDPKMVRFMIEHGADLKEPAGKDDIKPMGYAYSLALKDTRIDRNEVIGILDAALTQQARAGSDETAGP